MLDINSIPQLFALYRIGLTFGVLVPLLLGIAIAVVPLQLGARSLAFPRLAAAGFWTWFVGAVLVVVSIVANGGPGGGDAEVRRPVPRQPHRRCCSAWSLRPVRWPPRSSPPVRRA